MKIDIEFVLTWTVVDFFSQFRLIFLSSFIPFGRRILMVVLQYEDTAYTQGTGWFDVLKKELIDFGKSHSKEKVAVLAKILEKRSKQEKTQQLETKSKTLAGALYFLGFRLKDVDMMELGSKVCPNKNFSELT